MHSLGEQNFASWVLETLLCYNHFFQHSQECWCHFWRRTQTPRPCPSAPWWDPALDLGPVPKTSPGIRRQGGNQGTNSRGRGVARSKNREDLTSVSIAVARPGKPESNKYVFVTTRHGPQGHADPSREVVQVHFDNKDGSQVATPGQDFC